MFSVELLLIDTAPGSSESTDGIRGPWDLGLAPKGYCRASISHIFTLWWHITIYRADLQACSWPEVPRGRLWSSAWFWRVLSTSRCIGWLMILPMSGHFSLYIYIFFFLMNLVKANAPKWSKMHAPHVFCCYHSLIVPRWSRTRLLARIGVSWPEGGCSFHGKGSTGLQHSSTSY